MRSRIAFALTGLGLACCLVLSSTAAAPAASGNSKLKGTYAVAGTNSCLWAPGGFNSSFEPVDPSKAWGNSTATVGTASFDGAGTETLNTTDVSTNPPPTPGFTPGASSDTVSATNSYQVGKGGSVTVTAVDLSGTLTAGARDGQTFTIDGFTETGFLAPGSRGLTLAQSSVQIETITYSNGDSYPRICHRSATLIQVSK